MRTQTAIIVGVGSGLGAALVRAFAREGYTVIAAARSASALPTFEEGAERVVPIDCDATEPADVARVFEAAAASGPTEIGRADRRLQRRHVRAR